MKPRRIPVLIVDDDPVFAAYLRQLLKVIGPEFPCDVECAATTQAALDQLQRNHYELVLLDYNLPDSDGLTALARIRELPDYRQPAVIMLTGSGSEEIAVEAMKRGAKDYMVKVGLDMPTLIRAMTTALERKRLEEQVARYTEELRRKNEQMEAELAMAREIQESLLPREYPAFPVGVPAAQSALQFCHRWQPNGAVGGDFFEVVPLADWQAGVFLCDVMGHGVGAALVTTMVRGLVEELKPLSHDPSRFMGEINRSLKAILEQTDTPLFATAFYLVADVAEGWLTYANAGHPPPFLLQRQAGRVSPLRPIDAGPGPALGLLADSMYAAATHPLRQGDMILLYTDGLYEVEGPNLEEYGQERLFRVVQAHMQLPPRKLFDEILADIHRFQGPAEAQGFSDDVCLLAIEAARVGEASLRPASRLRIAELAR